MDTQADSSTHQEQFRAMRREDQAFVWDALYHALFVPPGAQALPRDVLKQPDIQRYAEGWMTRPGDLGVLVESNHVPIGAAWLRRWTTDDHGYGFVDESVPELSMAVLPGHRGRGLGTQLLERLLEAATDSTDAVSLSVSTNNPALRLYQRFDFTPVGAPEGGSLRMIRHTKPQRLRDVPGA